MAHIPLTEKYRPAHLKELVGNRVPITKVLDFVAQWKPTNTIKAVILLGPPGIGKTSAVYAIANDLQYSVTEINASDTRRSAEITTIIGGAANASSLSHFDANFKRLVLIDEVDGISGTYDRGGIPALKKIIASTNYPIILTANDQASDKVAAFSKITSMILFQRPSEFDVLELLEKIVQQEHASINDQQLQIIAEKAAGDIRAAINELEAALQGSGSLYLPASRNKDKILLDVFNDLFNAKNVNEATVALNKVPGDYGKFLNYLFDIAHNECQTPSELVEVYSLIANADLYLNRIFRTQNWGLLRYFFHLLGPGIFSVRQKRRRKNITTLTALPETFFAMGRSKSKNKVARALAPKVAPQLHISPKVFETKEFPLFTKIMRGKVGAYAAASLNLTDEELSMLTKLTGDSSAFKYFDAAKTAIGVDRVQQATTVHDVLPADNLESILSELIFEEHKATKKSQSPKKKPESTTNVTKATAATQASEKTQETTANQQSLDDFF